MADDKVKFADAGEYGDERPPDYYALDCAGATQTYAASNYDTSSLPPPYTTATTDGSAPETAVPNLYATGSFNHPLYDSPYNVSFPQQQQQQHQQQQQTTVIFQQPQPYAGPGVNFIDEPPNDHLGYSIFVTVMCCWLIGIFAIRKSSECRAAVAIGDMTAAQRLAGDARRLGNTALGIGIALYVVLVTMIALRLLAH